MNRKALIVDDDPSSIDILVATLDDAAMPYSIAQTADQALAILNNDSISVLFVRGFGADFRGADLCRDVRRTHAPNDVPILIMLKEDQLVAGAETLIAGATDLLVEPFEPREVRMRANIVPADQVRRVDQAHSIANEAPELAREPGFFVPEFDAQTKRFTFGANTQQQKHWDADPLTRRVALDKIIVCPCCDAVPTFRQGCGACGSAWVQEEVLLHHYACAHVGPESDFHRSSDMTCPKCRLTGLVAGSDFEQTDGCYRCLDCEAISTETKMIGHCLQCQHRFSAEDGKVKEIYGYQVGASPASAFVSAPNYEAANVREDAYISG